MANEGAGYIYIYIFIYIYMYIKTSTWAWNLGSLNSDGRRGLSLGGDRRGIWLCGCFSFVGSVGYYFLGLHGASFSKD